MRSSCISCSVCSVKKSWSEYIKDLFTDQRPNSLNLSLNDEVRSIMKEELRLAVKNMEKRNTVGGDDVALEMILAL